jgi:hypothetical protein
MRQIGNDKSASREQRLVNASAFIVPNLPEADFGPGITSGLPVIRPQLGPTVQVESKAISRNRTSGSLKDFT